MVDFDDTIFEFLDTNNANGRRLLPIIFDTKCDDYEGMNDENQKRGFIDDETIVKVHCYNVSKANTTIGSQSRFFLEPL